MTQPPTIIRFITTIAIIAFPLIRPTHAFSSALTPMSPCHLTPTPLSPLHMCPGGWGIGTPNEMQDGEFANTSSNQRRRRRKDSSAASEDYLEDVAYAVRDEQSSTEYEFVDTTALFAEKVRREKEQLRDRQRKDLMEVARIAGFGERVKPKANVDVDVDEEGMEGVGEVLGSFEDDLMEDDGLDSLDVRVKFD